ncbi:MAG: M48 family metalloprotease, partial [Vulcanisaeta sp.]
MPNRTNKAILTPRRLSENDRFAAKTLLTVSLIAMSAAVITVLVFYALHYWVTDLMSAIAYSFLAPPIFLLVVLCIELLLRLVSRFTGFLRGLFDRDRWFIRVNEPFGAVVGLFTFTKVIVGGDGDVYELIYNHEMTHYKGKDNIKVLTLISLITAPAAFLVFSLNFLERPLFTYFNTFFNTLSTILFVSIGSFILMMLRAFEVHADYGAFRVMGP